MAVVLDVAKLTQPYVVVGIRRVGDPGLAETPSLLRRIPAKSCLKSVGGSAEVTRPRQETLEDDVHSDIADFTCAVESGTRSGRSSARLWPSGEIPTSVVLGLSGVPRKLACSGAFGLALAMACATHSGLPSWSLTSVLRCVRMSATEACHTSDCIPMEC